MARIALHHKNLRRILAVEAGPLVGQAAARVAASTAAAAGRVDGRGVTINRYDDDATATRSKRYRVGLVLVHPTAKGRKAANDAAIAALKVSG